MNEDRNHDERCKNPKLRSRLTKQIMHRSVPEVAIYVPETAQSGANQRALSHVLDSKDEQGLALVNSLGHSGIAERQVVDDLQDSL